MNLPQLLSLAVQRSASDVHLACGMPPLARIHGTLIPLDETALSPQDCAGLISGVLTDTQRARLEEDWELDFVLDLSGIGRFRSNAHYVQGAVEAAFRLIPHTVPSLEQLGHRPSAARLCQLDEGLILITGTTGSGKSTTLASMIQAIVHQRSCVVVTIEDPVEYVFQSDLGIVKQREIGRDTKSFASALRHVLRQDPDVIVVSEMRDQETIEAAIAAAETGHLVLGTLHTIDAPKSIDRIIDIFPSDQQNQIVTQLCNCLQAIVSQHLLPKAEGQGRVMATETLIMNTAIRTCLRDRKTHMLHGLIEMGRHEGMNTLDESLTDLLQKKQITYDEAVLNARDPERLPKPEVKKRGMFG